MRLYPALLVLTACGRLQFEDAPDAALDAGCGDVVCSDPTLNGTGLLVIDVGGSDNTTFGYHGLAVQPDGKLVVVGKAMGATDTDAIAVRVLDDGTFDPGFGTGGVSVIDGGLGNDSGISVHVDRMGRILLGGASGSESFVTRLLPDGTVDGSFGFIRPAFGTNGTASTNGILVDAMDRVLIGGQGLFATAAFSLTTARLTTMATFDITFDGDGLVISDLYGADEFGALAALGPSGSVYMVGQSYRGPLSFDGVVLRLDANGARDPSFGASGLATLGIGSGTQRLAALAPDAAGRLVVAGLNDDDSLLARYLADGTLDASFGSGGITVVDRGTKESMKALVILPDGRIVAGGYANDPAGSSLLVLSREGELLGATTLGGGTGTINDLQLDSSGRVVVLGVIGGDLYLARVIIP